MRIKMLEMENKVFPDAIKVSSEARAAEVWSTRLGKCDLEDVIQGGPVYRKADTEYRIFSTSTMSYF